MNKENTKGETMYVYDTLESNKRYRDGQKDAILHVIKESVVSMLLHNLGKWDDMSTIEYLEKEKLLDVFYWMFQAYSKDKKDHILKKIIWEAYKEYSDMVDTILKGIDTNHTKLLDKIISEYETHKENKNKGEWIMEYKELTKKDFKNKTYTFDIDYVNLIFKKYNIKIKEGTTVYVKDHKLGHNDGQIALINNTSTVILFNTYDDAFSGQIAFKAEYYKDHLKLKTKSQNIEVAEYEEIPRNNISAREGWDRVTQSTADYVNRIFKKHNIQIIRKGISIGCESDGSIQLRGHYRLDGMDTYQSLEDAILLFPSKDSAEKGLWLDREELKKWIKIQKPGVKQIEVLHYFSPIEKEKTSSLVA